MLSQHNYPPNDPRAWTPETWGSVSKLRFVKGSNKTILVRIWECGPKKRCFDCKSYKLVDAYYLLDGTVDGLCCRCSDCSKQMAYRYKERTPLRPSFHLLRKSAKRRGIPFFLSFEEFCRLAELTHCPVRGVAYERGHPDNSRSFDRLDSSGPYSFENVLRSEE